MKQTQGAVTLDLLQSFCSTDDSRAVLLKPFTISLYTYASDGRIMIRTCANAAIQPLDLKKHEKFVTSVAKIAAWDHARIGSSLFQSLPDSLPEVPIEKCLDCDGHGKWKDGATCEDCGGTGQYIRNRGVEIGNRRLAEQYLHKLATLPNCRIAPTHGGELEPMPFVFEGGCGYLMPMRKKTE